MGNYLSTKLLSLLNARQSKKIGIIGRGGGKSTYVGWELYSCFQQMPRSLGGLYGPTYNQILTKIFPSAKKMLIAAGLKEDRPGSPGHFVIGRRPPKHWKKRPVNEPEKWEYIISLWTGSAAEFISMDRPELQRGGSYDYQIFDEAVLVPKAFHDRVAETSLRGNIRHFGHCYRHGMQVYVSSQAHSQLGFWVEDQRWMKGEDGAILRDADGNRIADPNVFFTIGSSYDNVAILGEKTIARWRKSMPKTVFDIEVMSQRGEKLPNGFYPGFDTSKHTYISGYEYDYDEQSEFGVYTRRTDTDRITTSPLLLTCDFNAVQNTLLVAQEQRKTLRFLNEFYEVGTSSVEAWLKPFVDYYANHTERKIYLYGDPGGNKVATMQQISLFTQVANYLRMNKWEVTPMMQGRAYPNHLQKQKFFHEVFAETNERLPVVRIHYTRCKWLIISLDRAGINPDFTKNKKSELQEIDQREATHASDAWDYLIWYRYMAGVQTPSAGGIRIGTNEI